MNKALRALEVIGYKFPEDKRRIVNTLNELPFEIVSQLRDVYKHEYEFGLNQMNDLLDSVVFSVCGICDKEEAAYGDLPEHWGWLIAKNPADTSAPYLMCDECQIRYVEKFNEEPIIKRGLDE